MPTYEDPRFSGLFELLPHRNRNGKEGYMVARGKHKSPASKGEGTVVWLLGKLTILL